MSVKLNKIMRSRTVAVLAFGLVIGSWAYPVLLGPFAVLYVLDTVAFTRRMKREPEYAALVRGEYRYVPPGTVTAHLAAFIAGRKRALENGFLADLTGDPEGGVNLTARQRKRLAAGFLRAAIRMRLRDLARPFWVPIDWLVATRPRTNAATTALVGAVMLYVQAYGGFLTVVTDLPGFAILWTGVRLLARWLRSIRGIEIAAAKNDS